MEKTRAARRRCKKPRCALARKSAVKSLRRLICVALRNKMEILRNDAQARNKGQAAAKAARSKHRALGSSLMSPKPKKAVFQRGGFSPCINPQNAAFCSKLLFSLASCYFRFPPQKCVQFGASTPPPQAAAGLIFGFWFR